jgi:hypothetical protein
MSTKRQMRLGAFMRPVSIHTGAWRYPGAWPDANFNFAPHQAPDRQTLERGKFDAFFMADHLAVLNMPIEALKRSATVTVVRPADAAAGARHGDRAHRADRDGVHHLRRRPTTSRASSRRSTTSRGGRAGWNW